MWLHEGEALLSVWLAGGAGPVESSVSSLCRAPGLCWPDHLLWAPSLSQHHPGSKFPLTPQDVHVDCQEQHPFRKWKWIGFYTEDSSQFFKIRSDWTVLGWEAHKALESFVSIPYAGLREQPVWCSALRFGSRGCSLSLIFVQLGQMFLGALPKEQWICCLAQNRKLWKFWKILLISS